MPLLVKLSVIGLLASLSAWAQVNDFQHTQRVVNGVRVDLSPIVQSLSHGSDSTNRVLKAWKVLTGRKVGEASLGWIVQAQVEGASARVLLKNPPNAEWQQFQQLKSRHAALSGRLQALNASGSSGSAGRPMGRRQNQTRPASANASEVAAIKGELKKISESGYNLSEEFPVHCLALKTGMVQDGMPVYDRGRIVK